jgi:hypothetical protein
MEGILRLQQSTTALPSGAAALDYASFIGHRETVRLRVDQADISVQSVLSPLDEANGRLGNERTRATHAHQVIDTEVGFM